VAERIEKALKYYGGINSPVVVIKVVITHPLSSAAQFREIRKKR